MLIDSTNFSFGIAPSGSVYLFVLLEQAKEATAFQNQLQIALITAQAKNEMAKRWNGALPSSILPQGSQLLLGLDSATTK